jgi:hypothetical protein
MIKRLLELLFNRPKPLQDALIDERPFTERQKNWLDIEFAMGSDDYKWQDYNAPRRQYFPYDQAQSLSCVAGAPAIWLEHFRKTISSRKDAYIRRANRPAGGMAMWDMINISRAGVALESQVPSQGLGETAMNAGYLISTDMIATRKKNKIKGAVYISQRNNIDALAKATENSPVSIFLAFDTSLQSQEYWNSMPRVINQNLNIYATATSRHQVIAHRGVLIDGKKYLEIQDTAGIGTGSGTDRNIRYLSEDFVSKRVYEATYSLPEIEVTPPSKKPKWTGKRNLGLGSVGDDVRRLQEILQVEGCFDFPNPTGYLGGITRAGIIKLQNKYAKEILHPLGLKSGTGFLGLSSRAFLEKNYS